MTSVVRRQEQDDPGEYSDASQENEQNNSGNVGCISREAIKPDVQTFDCIQKVSRSHNFLPRNRMLVCPFLC